MNQKVFLVVIVLSILCSCACAPTTHPAQSNPPTQTAIPLPTKTSAPTQPPAPTATPTPQVLNLQGVLAKCEELSANHESVVVEGKIFLPEFAIYGYEGWKGMHLAERLTTDTERLIVLIQVGDGPNTMNALPQFFNERDLAIRAFDDQVVHHGYSVVISGRPKYNADKPERKCEVWADRIESRMPVEVSLPLATEISYLLEEQTIGHGMQEKIVKQCEQLADQKQLVTIHGSIDDTQGAVCNMGACLVTIKDPSGSMFASLVNLEAPNSMLVSTEIVGPNGWKVLDSNGIEVGRETLALTGVLYSDAQGCRLAVYTVESR
jgi:hypothetical protein